MSTQTLSSSEDAVKSEITKFLTAFRQAANDLNTPIDYNIFINGGVFQGQQIFGFIPLKEKVLKIMQQPPDNTSYALNYINSSKKNLL